MKTEYTHLTREERKIIYVMLCKGETDSEIAKEICRPRSTIWRERHRNKLSRELRKNLDPLQQAKEIHEIAVRRRSDSKRGPRGSIKQVSVRELIVECLEERKYSPETIALKVKAELGVNISGKTIRRWINSNYQSLRQHLALKGKKPRQRLTNKQKQYSDGTIKKSIHDREEEVNNRSRIGDYEADLIVCNQSRVCILSVRERVTREAWLRLLPNSESETVRKGLMGIFANIPSILCCTCTFDNGSEFAKVYEIEKLLSIKAYWCDAYCSWQKGSVEEQNKEVRRHIPKGTDLSTISADYLARIQFYLNDKPRGCLGGFSSEELWQSALAKIRNSMH